MKRVASLLKRWSTDQLITGIELQDWMGMLGKNGWKVSPAYLHRAAWVTGWSVPSTLLGRAEDAIYSRELSAMEVNPTPLFILGHWRSGTTHLHNLIGRDPNHTYPTIYQVIFPTSFLLTDNVIPPMTSGLLSDTRTYDNVKNGWHEAAEDEIALAKMTGLSPYISFMFPDNAPDYEKYVDFLEADEDERKRWKEALIYFIKKIMLAEEGKRVVVKSCTHSARIRILLEMFPDAKFIHIHRNPYEVFASTVHMRSHTDWENFFQVPYENVEEQRVEQTAIIGERIYRRLIEDRSLIPEKNFYEIAYDDFCGNELEKLREIYTQFELPDWDQYEASISDYLEEISGYQRNKLKINRKLKKTVYDRWKFVFDEFGYDQEYGK